MTFGTEARRRGKCGLEMNRAYRYLSSAFSRKRVLVTGHTGFKGSWLSLWLKELGAEVIGYALDPYTPRDNFVLNRLSQKITDIRGDIRDVRRLRSVFRRYSPEYVFHLAAQPIVRISYAKPKETFDINVGGTVNIFECCRITKSVRVIINITSDKCYENKEWVWGYRENDPVGGYDPYSSSKGCSELITAAYRKSFFNPSDFSKHEKALSSARAGNVIGGGDWAKDRIIPDCVRALEKKQPIQVRNPCSVRPWQYVLEPLGGYLLLAARMNASPKKYCGAWNFGPEGTSISKVQEIVESAIKCWGSGSWKPVGVLSERHEASMLVLDINKAKLDLAWKPCLTLAEAVKNTIGWYKARQNRQDLSAFCRSQIHNYMDRMIIR